jgi:hypothetical protein
MDSPPGACGRLEVFINVPDHHAFEKMALCPHAYLLYSRVNRAARHMDIRLDLIIIIWSDMIRTTDET